MLRAHNSFSVPCFLLWTIFAFGIPSAPRVLAATAVESTSSPAIVIGFVGGFVRHNNLVHTEVSLAARLRNEYPSGVYVEVFENHRGQSAYKKILQLLDTDHSGELTAKKKQTAR